jgi:MFS family permease
MATQKSARLKRIQNVALTLLVIAGLINYLDRSTLSIANHSIREDMNLSATQMGALLSAFSIPYAFAQLPMGVMLDKFGARVMLGFGMMLWSVAQVAGGLVNSLNQFYLARVVLGVGEAPQFPAAAKVFSDWWAVHERGKPTGIAVASTTIAPALAPPLLTGLMLAFGWRGMFIIMGVLGILAAIAWYVAYRDRRDTVLTQEELDYLEGEGVKSDDRNMTGAEWRGLFKERTTWGLIFGFMGVIYMVWLYLTWLPSYLSDERGLTLAKVGWVAAIPYIFGTFGQLFSGVIADKLLAMGQTPINSRKWPICIGLVGAAAFTIPAAYTPSLVLAMTYISVAMFFINLSSGGSWALVSVAAPRRLVASLGSLQNFGGYLGGSVAPVLTGVIVDRTGSFVNALLVAAAVAVVGALFYLFVVKEPINDPGKADA